MIDFAALEERLAETGVPTRFLPMPTPDEVEHAKIDSAWVEVVCPQNEEIQLDQTLRELMSREHAWFDRCVEGQRTEFRYRTILYHLAYEVFGVLTNQGLFVSTNIVNVKTPHQSTKNGRTVYHYDVDIVLISESGSWPAHTEDQVTHITREYQADSRFLRLNNVRVALTRARAILPGDPPLIYSTVLGAEV